MVVEPRLRTGAPPRGRARSFGWDDLSEPAQLNVAVAALRRAAATIAFQAETLACEMETGRLEEQGGPEALRLLAAIVRVNCEDGLGGPSHR